MAAGEQGVSAATAARHQRLEQTWCDPSGFWGWFQHVHHTSIGKRYIVTAFIFFALGGILALVMRLQLARPENAVLGPDKYNQFFTMHGSTMMFLFAVPMMFEALSVYFVPLMVGARNIAFPRLNAFSYYIYTAGGVMLYTAFILNIGPDAGWFSYVPLSGPAFSPGKRVDMWAQMITFTELSALAVAVEIIVTVFKLRAPGMSLNRIPMFVWAEVVTAFSVIFAMPAVMLASTMLIMDRLVSTHFFNPAEGGDAILYQHLFWFFGHPEVYIIFLPGTGIVSTIIVAFARRKIFGYTALVLSTVATGFIGFGVWVHHMFATGLPQMSINFFTAASLMIVIPTGVQFFCWLTTLSTGRLNLRTPLLWVFGFFFVFLIGGLSGVMLASVPVDWQVHDTFFVVAHFHYVLIGGALFPLFGAMYYWLPKITGRMLNQTLGSWNFWLFFFGFNLTFFPMHILGLEGMPRRVYTYLPEVRWGGLNTIVTAGAMLMGVGVLVFLVNVVSSVRRGALAGNNPWQAGTLEWATTSPPPIYNFLDLPTVDGREPLWENPPDQPVVTGLREDLREVLVTFPTDADPDHRFEMPSPSIWPFLAAIAVSALFVGSIFTPWAVPIGAVPVAITLTGWFWPKRGETELRRGMEKWDDAHSKPNTTRRVLDVSATPTVVFGHRTLIWWGTMGMMAIEGTMFAITVATYFFLRTRSTDWPPGLLPPGLWAGTANTAIFLASVVPAMWTKKVAEKGELAPVRLGLIIMTVIGVVNLILRVFEFGTLNSTWDANAYASVTWMLLGLHTVHLVTDWFDTAVLTVMMFTSHVEGKRYMDTSENSDYWYFVVFTWLPIYAVLYFAPRLL